MSKKFKFELEGLMFELPIKYLKRVDWNGKPLKSPKIDMSHVAAANVVKQYVKKKYPNVVVSSSSSSFSMGNSVSVYLSDERGNEVDKSIVKDVDRFGSQFEYGQFNGMIDMYEHHDKDVRTDNGTEIDYGVKYFHVNNYPKFCSVPDIVRMIKGMTINSDYVFGNIPLNDALTKIKDYGATENNIQKALKLV